ncbi:Abhydrolase domain-containing protein [Ceratobasidium sp. AG-Ba]|nr:Abhydrolase domain-containing protein [Ceratobasidium sp. AG-Ba]
MQAMTGDRYDLISWDPLGAFWKGTVLHPGIEAPIDFSNQTNVDEFMELAIPAGRVLQGLKEKCQHQTRTTLSYVGTTATVRDLVSIHDAIEEPEAKLNFWGFSYGTLIGQYFVNMFPERVGRVALEGVVDPEYWANKPPHESWSITATHIDEMLEKFAIACSKSSSCCLAENRESDTEILAQLQNLITSAYEYKKGNGTSTLISSGAIRHAILRDLPYPSQWRGLARQLCKIHDQLGQDKTSLLNQFAPQDFLRHSLPNSRAKMPHDEPPHYSFQAITCADAADSVGVNTTTVFQELARVAAQISPKFGPAWGEGGLYCHEWPYRAVERYSGPWNVSFPNSEPLLIIGSALDSVTPFKSAEKVARLFGEKAVLVKQEAHGHVASWDQEHRQSQCTFSIVQNYFVDGILPESGVTCEADQTNPFA